MNIKLNTQWYIERAEDHAGVFWVLQHAKHVQDTQIAYLVSSIDFSDKYPFCKSCSTYPSKYARDKFQFLKGSLKYD